METQVKYIGDHCITFDPGPHLYTVDGRPVKSVTQILNAEFDPFRNVPPDKLLTAQERGTAVHTLTHLDDLGTLDPESIDPALAGYLEGYRKFKRECKPKIEAREMMVFSSVYWIIGTLDIVAKLQAHRAVIDIKTGLKAELTGLQTASYAFCWEEMFPRKKIEKRWGLHLTKTGGYKLEPYESKSDLPDFLAALRCQRTKERIGLL